MTIGNFINTAFQRGGRAAQMEKLFKQFFTSARVSHPTKVGC
jgi:hypothetical protein